MVVDGVVARRRVARLWEREEVLREGLARVEEMVRCISAVLGPSGKGEGEEDLFGGGGGVSGGFLLGVDEAVMLEVTVLVVVGSTAGISCGESRG